MAITGPVDIGQHDLDGLVRHECQKIVAVPGRSVRVDEIALGSRSPWASGRQHALHDTLHVQLAFLRGLSGRSQLPPELQQSGATRLYRGGASRAL